MGNIQPINTEEEKLQDTMDKLCNDISSQLGIPEWKAESAVKTAIKTYDTFIQKELKKKREVI